MNRGDLLERAFDILGDDRSNPREYTESEIIELMNEGNRVFRTLVEDHWASASEDVVAGVAIYTVPSTSVRLRRVAFDDQTLPPQSILWLVALDEKWQTRTGKEPIVWTAEGLPHNQYRVYKTPTVSTDKPFTFAADPKHTESNVDLGTIVRYTEDGVDATFITDPANPSHTDPELGVTIAVQGTAQTVQVGDTEGVVVQAVLTNTKNLTVWFVRRPVPMGNDLQTVPIKNAYQKAPLWYSLWQLYEQEEERHNAVLAGLFKERFEGEVNRGRLRAASPTPYMIHKIGTTGVRRNRRFTLRYPDEIVVDGTPIEITFPRRTLWR